MVIVSHVLVGGVLAARLTDKAYEKTHGLKNCPNLVLYRDDRPIVYDGGRI